MLLARWLDCKKHRCERFCGLEGTRTCILDSYIVSGCKLLRNPSSSARVRCRIRLNGSFSPFFSPESPNRLTSLPCSSERTARQIVLHVPERIQRRLLIFISDSYSRCDSHRQVICGAMSCLELLAVTPPVGCKATRLSYSTGLTAIFTRPPAPRALLVAAASTDSMPGSGDL